MPARSAGPEAFWKRVDRSGGPLACWPWLGSIGTGGYGHVAYQGAHLRAHRLSYELSVGQIPSGLQLDHLCRNRRCVNPQHLEAVTQRTNVLRGEGAAAVHARQTHCVHGHSFDESNTRRDRNGHRVCRACDSIRPRGSRPSERREGPRRPAPRKDACLHGHLFDEANTYMRINAAQGRRQCRECNRQSAARYKARQQALTGPERAA